MRIFTQSMIAGILILICSCNPKPEEIRYGEEGCQFCQMTIIDPRYGSEIVTTKGKVYTFDAVECMINYIKENSIQESEIALTLVNDYTNPEGLNEAKTCTYLISKNMPSPMGMYITPFVKRDSALTYQSRNGGLLFSWKELNENFTDLPDLIK